MASRLTTFHLTTEGMVASESKEITATSGNPAEVTTVLVITSKGMESLSVWGFAPWDDIVRNLRRGDWVRLEGSERIRAWLDSGGQPRAERSVILTDLRRLDQVGERPVSTEEVLATDPDLVPW